MKVLLHNQELWQKFSEYQNEMMITNSGRRMCPVMSVTFEDLKPLQFYTVMIDFVLVDEFRYSFDVSSNRWVPHWRALAEEDSPRFYVHPTTPAMGMSLMQDVLTFKKLKLTNSPKTAAKSAQAVLLNTMRRYIPRIHVLESASGIYFDCKLRKEFHFPETEFMAVTQYRNKQIANLKIDANPFAKAYRSDGLHGKAKRRRMESMAACEDWKTPESGPPSNSSSLEDFFVNNDEPGVENNSSPSEPVEEPSSEENFPSNERQVNVMRQVSPCQTGSRKDVSEEHYAIQDETHHQESLSTVSQVTQNLSTHQTNETESRLTCEESMEWMWGFDEQMSNVNEIHHQESLSTVSQVTQNQSTHQTNETESRLTCEESTEWMWGFDEQMSMRYASINQLDGFVKPGDISSNLSNNATVGNEASKDAGIAAVNRRKKYLPRRLQRTSTTSSKIASSVFEANEEPTENEQTDKPTVNQVDFLSSQPKNAISICGDSNKDCHETEQSPASPCFEPPEKTSVITSDDSSQEQKINSHTNAILSRFRTEKGLFSLSGQDVSHLGCDVSGETYVSRPSCSLSTPWPEGTSASSLNALIQMCSEAGGRLSRCMTERKREMVAMETSKKWEGTHASEDSSTGEEFADGSSSSSEESEGPVSSRGGDSLSEQPVEKSSTSSRCQLEESHCNVSDSLTSEDKGVTIPSPIPTVSSSSGLVTSSDITETSPVVSRSGNNNNSSSSCNVVNKSPTTTNQCQAGSTAVTIANPNVEDPLPVIVDIFSGYYLVNGVNSGQPEGNKQQGYRPIIPAPNQSVNIVSDDPTRDASVANSNSIPYPIIVDSFSINENFRYAVGHRSFKYKILEAQQQARLSNSHYSSSPPPQVNRGYFSSPISNQAGHSSFIALDNTLLMQAFSLEKFYSFSIPEHRAHAARLRPKSRYYKATRTNFSRLSLEPICSVIHPLISSTLQSTSQKSATEVANQRAWGWQT